MKIIESYQVPEGNISPDIFKLRGDIFIAMLNRSGYKHQLLDDVDYIVCLLKAQDQKLF